MHKVATDVQEFIKQFPVGEQQILRELDQLIRQSMPEVEATLWQGVFWSGTEQSIIGYADMVFINSKKQEVPWFIVGLAKQKHYFSLYFNALKDGKSLIEAFGPRLQGPGKKLKATKSLINFTSLDQFNLKELGNLLASAQ